MTEVKKLCPACGAANSLERTRCHVCAADIRSNLPVPAGERLPIPWKEVGASLALSAGVVALRAGLQLARHLWERKAASPMGLRERTYFPGKVRRWLPRRGEVQEAPPQRLQVRVRGQRVWGRWSSDGASQLEVEEFDWQAVGGER